MSQTEKLRKKLALKRRVNKVSAKARKAGYGSNKNIAKAGRTLSAPKKTKRKTKKR